MPLRQRLARLAAALALALPMLAGAQDVLVSQVYGGGGNSGAPYRDDFVELFNRGAVPVTIGGWSIQYAGANADRWQTLVLPASARIEPGRYYLVRLGSGGANGAALPPADLSGAIGVAAGAGKIALVRSPVALAGLCPSDADIVDFVGYGAASCAMGSATAPALGNAAAAVRLAAGCLASGINAADFAALAPVPRSSATPAVDCSGTIGVAARIHDVQGRAHRSPLENQLVVDVTGVVTLVRPDGFFMQETEPDADPYTSEGIYVATFRDPQVAAGDALRVAGRVEEFRANGNATALTRIIATGLERLAAGQPLPEPVTLGAGGRIIPSEIYASARGNIENATAFDPATNALDFYETLEGMRVRLNDTVAVAPNAPGGEAVVLADEGLYATGPRGPRGALVVRSGDFNPERLVLSGASAPLPEANVGDSFGTAIGVLTVFGNNPGVLAAEHGPFIARGLLPERAAPAAPGELTVASYNLENLDPFDADTKFAALGEHIARNLAAPDIVGVVEVQDDSGPAADGVITAGRTLGKLVDAIVAAGGPRYQWRSIDPQDGQDGGEPGGNIRPAFLFNPARVAFVDRPGGDATTPVTFASSASGVTLSHSPGRIEPANAAWKGSRKPLAAEFLFNGARVFAVLVHLNSKTGDQPLAGRFQPPIRQSEAQRADQSQVLAAFTTGLLAIDPDARLVMLGDFNDFEFSGALATLKSSGLADFVETLPPEARYTYNYEGNAQAIDHMLVSARLAADRSGYAIVHVNSEFARQASDHDPELARFAIGPADVTAQVGVRRFRSASSGDGRTWNTLFRLTHHGAAPLLGPLALVLDGVPSAIAISGATGTLADSPVIAIGNDRLDPGGTRDVRVTYTAAPGTAFTYHARVFNGTF